jgi:exonuclease SbcC
MTLISKEKSGKAFCTAMADEEDGNLDAGNAQNFIHMYRAFIEAGGFDDCFFISHRPECVAMADHVLTFGNGGITIN